MVTKSELAKFNRTSGCRSWTDNPEERKGLCYAHMKCYCKWFRPLNRRIKDYRESSCRHHDHDYCTCWAAVREAREEHMRQKIIQAMEEL